MAMQQYALTPARIGKFKGEILKHAVPFEVLAKQGRQVAMPKNSSDTYVARRVIPYGASSANPNQFFANGVGDRGNAMRDAHLTQEGVTPTADSVNFMDITAIISQFSCLYSLTDKVFDMYEDDIPEQIKMQIGERVALVNEMIIYGALKSCTNVFYSNGSAQSAVNTIITLNMLRKIARKLVGNHAKPVTNVLKASQNVKTEAVESAFMVICHPDLEADVRNLTGFMPSAQYASGSPLPNEIGRVERFRFVISPDLPSTQAGGGTITSGAFVGEVTATTADVYPFIVLAQDAFSQIALRGSDSLDPTVILPGEKTKSDPLGQRGYFGTSWYKAVMIENNGWMALGYCAATGL